MACMLLLCGAAINVRAGEPTAETTETSVESVGEQALTPRAPMQLSGPPPAAPHSWANGSADRRIESPDLDVPERPPERH